MSHFSTIKTQLVSQEHLIQALHDMGVQNLKVDKKETIRFRGHGLLNTEIRFSRNAQGRFEVRISDEQHRTFDTLWFQNLMQRYAYHVAIDMIRQQDFELVNESTSEDNTIHLTLRRMG